MSVETIRSYARGLPISAELVPCVPNLVDRVWERDKREHKPAFILDAHSLAGRPSVEKLAELRRRIWGDSLGQSDLYGYLLTELDDIACWCLVPGHLLPAWFPNRGLY